jgi:hypothetical protein
MKTQTAEEYLENCGTLDSDNLKQNVIDTMNEFATTQIEELRDRLVEVYGLEQNIHKVVDEFLKEINP